MTAGTVVGNLAARAVIVAKADIQTVCNRRLLADGAHASQPIACQLAFASRQM